MFNLNITTRPSNGAGFILVDGTFLMIELNRDLLEIPTKAIAVHPYLDIYLEKKFKLSKKYPNEKFFCSRYNSIAINDGTNLEYEVYIDLQYNVTTKQWESLLSYLDFLILKGRKKLQVRNVCNIIKDYDFISKDNPDGWLPEDIIKDLKRNLCLNKN